MLVELIGIWTAQIGWGTSAHAPGAGNSGKSNKQKDLEDMKTAEKPTKRQEVERIVGNQLIYTYESGWLHELYIKNDRTVDYRIHGGLIGGSWARNQSAHIVRLGSGIYGISWNEPTGTVVSIAVNMAERRLHSTIVLPRWIVDHPKKTALFHNDHEGLLRAYRDAGPTYPKLIIDDCASINHVLPRGENNESVICCAPSDLPSDYFAIEPHSPQLPRPA